MIIKGLNFIETCSACPEQYDVENQDGEIVGYIRLRYGCLTCDYPDVNGKTIYTHYFDEEWMGCFNSNGQQMEYLNIIADKILEKMNTN